MRVVAGIVILLAALGWLAAGRGPTETTVARTEHEPAVREWRRTTDGWEHPTWRAATPRFEPTLHPWVVAAFEALLVLLLWALADRSRTTAAEATRKAPASQPSRSTRLHEAALHGD